MIFKDGLTLRCRRNVRVHLGMQLEGWGVPLFPPHIDVLQIAYGTDKDLSVEALNVAAARVEGLLLLGIEVEPTTSDGEMHKWALGYHFEIEGSQGEEIMILLPVRDRLHHDAQMLHACVYTRGIENPREDARLGAFIGDFFVEVMDDSPVPLAQAS